MYYCVILILLLFCVRLYDFGNLKRGRNKAFYFVLFNFVIMAGLRYRLGLDSIHYQESYDLSPSFTTILENGIPISRYGILWVLLVSFLKEISLEFTLLQFTLAVIVNLTFFSYFKKNTKFLFTAITIYYLFFYLYFNTEILRESLSVCFFIFSLDFFNKNKWVKYYLVVSIGVFFHYSALVCILFPLVKIIKYNKYFYLKMMLIFSFFYFFWSFLAKDNLFKFLIDADTLSSSQISNYMESKYVYNVNGLILTAVIYLLLPYYILTRFKYNLIKYNLNYFYVILYLLIGFMVLFNSVIFKRFTNYLVIPLITIISNIFYIEYQRTNYRFKTNKIIIIIIIIIVPRIYLYFREESKGIYFYDRYFPYTNIIDKEKSNNRELLYDLSKEN